MTASGVGSGSRGARIPHPAAVKLRRGWGTRLLTWEWAVTARAGTMTARRVVCGVTEAGVRTAVFCE